MTQLDSHHAATVTFASAQTALRTIADLAVPRLFVLGTAGSGTTALLDEAADILIARGTDVHYWRPATSIAELPRSATLVVDDAHRLDAQVIGQLHEHVSKPDAGLIIGARPWPRSEILTDIARTIERSIPMVVLGQLSRRDVLALQRTHAFQIPDRDLARITEFTGGISWLVIRAMYLYEYLSSDDDPELSGIRQVLADEIAARVAREDDDLKQLIEVVSINPQAMGSCPDADPRIADALIAQGHAEGLLLRNGQPAPIVREAVMASTPAHRHAGLKTVGEQHADPDPATGPAPSSAARALDAWRQDDLDTAATILDALDPAAGNPHDDGLTDLAAAIWSARGMPQISSDSYLARPPISAQSSARAAIAHLGVGMPERAIPAQKSSPAPTTLGVALQLLEEGLAASLAPVPDLTALLDLVRASELYTASRHVGPIPELPAVIAAAVAIAAGQPQTARDVMVAAVEGGQGGDPARARLLLWQAFASIYAERPADAREALAQAERLIGRQSTRDLMLLGTVRIMLARHYEDVQALRAAWNAAVAHRRHTDVSIYSLLPLGALIDAGARLGEASLLGVASKRALDLIEALGSPPLWSNHLHWAFVQQGILLNEPARLASHAQALVAAAPHSAVAAAMAQAGSMWVAVLAGNADPGQAETAARALAAVGLAWDGARLASHAAQRVSSDRRAAARLLACARELHPPEQARTTPAAETVQPATAQREPNPLSERENDIAQLILQGKTYAEIGESIFISPRTVEHHVASIRRRLDATSRSDLIAKLRLVIGASLGV